ncbi:MAG: signal peptide peptidase SppA [Alphaproteobacteria bacterium]|nr:signal peptide peptidase SppA [Alphaproteobacteria bacterium]
MIRSVLKFIFSTFFWICSVIGIVFVSLIFFLYLGGIGPFSPSTQPLKKDSVLSIILNGTYVEHTDSKGIGSLFLGKEASLYELTQGIIKAASDDKIKGLVVRIESPSLGTAQLQELREALSTFRDSGKPNWCYTDSFGDSSSGTGLYYLATACEEIWLQPLGTVNLTGINLEVPFGKNALEKLDITPEIAQRKEYKSFVEMFTRDDFSEASREAQQAIADSILSQIVESIAKDRKLSHDHVRFLIANGPYLTQEALKEKLVDKVEFRQALIAVIKERLGQQIPFLKMASYLQNFQQSVPGDKVALIFGSGTIQRDGGRSPLDEVVISSNATEKAFQQAADDKDVKAIVYRINSPGGSPVASETIYNIIRHTQQVAKKPVIISMSDAAASGGYWVSLAGSKIIAQPATLTGSIGVFGGKFIVSGLLEKLGVHIGNISTSDNATMWSFTQSFNPAQWMKLNAIMDDVYQNFTSRVAQNRHMTLEQVEKVARGRVWTGEQALALGLVDQLGSLTAAIALAKKEAGLPPTAGIAIYPPSKTLLEELASLMDDSEDDSSHQVGVLGIFFQPLKKVMSVWTLLTSSPEILEVPLAEVKL